MYNTTPFIGLLIIMPIQKRTPPPQDTFGIERYVNANDPVQYYSDLTPSQKTLLLYLYLNDGNVLHPPSYAKFFQVEDQNIYALIRSMSPIVGIVRIGHGQWVLMKFAKKHGYQGSE